MGNTVAPGNQLPSGEVTFLFTDIEGSTRLACELGDGYRQVLNDHRRLLRGVFTRYTGTELLTEGDSFFVAFRDADTAVRAALRAQSALAAHNWPHDPRWNAPARPKVRMGIHTGQATPDQHGYASSTVHRAARVCSAAHGDQILCSESTIKAIRDLSSIATHIDLGLHMLRGFDDAERLHQLAPPGESMTFPPPTTQRRHHNLPAFEDDFVGRHSELDQLERVLETHRLTSVTALPRAGKTRLVCRLAELLAPRYHDGVWYAPLSGDETPATALASALGLRGDPFRTLLQTVVETLRHKESLLVFDDARPHHAAQITQLLYECPNVRVLSAAPRPLGLPGEVKWALPTLKVLEAADLLRRRASSAAGGIDVGDCTPIASYVDGFPPAINILARAVPLFGASGLLRLLERDPLRVLDARGELSTILDEVYGQLTPEAARLLRVLAERERPAGVDDVQLLCQESSDALDALIRLVDVSLVDVQITGDGAVYRLPAPVRWYADARRRASGDHAMPPQRVPAATTPVPALSWVMP